MVVVELDCQLSFLFLLLTQCCYKTDLLCTHPSYIDCLFRKEGFSSVLYSSYTLGLTSIGLLVLQAIYKRRYAVLECRVADNTMCAFVSVYIKWISIYTCKIFNTIYSFDVYGWKYVAGLAR